MTKYELKDQKEKESEIKRTLRKARIPKDATPEQIKSCLINYVAKGKLDYRKIRFSDELMADPDFLLSIYRANPNMTLHCKFYPKKELQDNVDFMIEYVKIRHTTEMQSIHMQDNSNWCQTKLEWIADDYTKAMANPEFITKLAKAFPEQKIIPLIKYCYVKIHAFTLFWKEKEKQDMARYKECLSSLPVEILCEDVRKHGWRVLTEVPNDIANFNKLVSAGIEKDGFGALGYLHITQVVDNKDLVVKAYEKEGIQKLIEYIKDSLSPNRTRYYYCNGEMHNCAQYDQKYEDVQKALIASPEIQEIFRKEKLIVSTKELRTSYLSIEQCK